MVSFRFVSEQGRFGRFVSGSSPYYGGLWRKVLWSRALFSLFIVAATLHAAGHAVTALAAGLLGSALASPSGVTSLPFKVPAEPAILASVGLVATLRRVQGPRAV